MRKFASLARKFFLSEEEGASMAEYALLCALISIALLVVILGVRNEISNTFSKTTSVLANANSQP